MPTIDPFAVNFSQASIRFRFSDGTTLDELVAALRAGRVDGERLPPIRLVTRGDLLFTLDNRRLEVYRRAGRPVPYRWASPEEERGEQWKFTTRNGGISVRVRGEFP